MSCESRFSFVRVHRLAFRTEVLCSNMQRLMDVAYVVCEQNDRDRLGDLTLILFGDFSAQHPDAVGNHVNKHVNHELVIIQNENPHMSGISLPEDTVANALYSL